MLGLESEERLLGHGVSTCATCDGFFFRDKAIGVVGGGDTAIEEALFLTKFASTVTVIHRRDELRASKIMQDRAFANDKIEFRWNAEVDEVLGDRPGRGRHAARHHQRRVLDDSTVDGLFVAIGHTRTPGCSRASSSSTRTATSSPKPDSTRTSVDGVFAAGDVQDHVYRQAITAAGSGCMAAIEAERWLAGATSTPERRAPRTRRGIRGAHPVCSYTPTRSVIEPEPTAQVQKGHFRGRQRS